EIELCMTTDSRSFDLSKREADIAVRTLPLSMSPPEHLIGTRLAPVTVASYVATAHAHRLAPELPGTTPRWISYEDRLITERMIAASSHPDVPPWGSFSSLPLMLQATREGLGISMLPTYVGDRDPALHRLAHPDLRHLADLWLLSHLDLRDNARFRAARHAVSGALRRHQPLFRGEGWRESAPERPEIAPEEFGASSVG
ncbi:MAG: DNA-binding transcriptional LysR family regulator, partial [Myxococcota bacterium]